MGTRIPAPLNPPVRARLSKCHLVNLTKWTLPDLCQLNHKNVWIKKIYSLDHEEHFASSYS